ncbi:hypothetical protein APSETT444_010009 [Aspergillus pseudonomiae]
MADDPPGAEIAGVVVGAVLLFGAISLVPISICLSTLVVPSSSQDTLPSSPEPACILPPSRSTTALHRHDTLTPDADPPLVESDRTRYRYRDGDRSVLVLNQCNHAFHASCLASWFAYGRYKCPICQTEYSPTDPG